MDKKRIIGIGAAVVAAAIGIPALACCGYMGSIMSQMPANQGAHVDAGGVVGVETSGSYAWVVPTDTGVVLVDVGIDPEAVALREEIGDRTVHAIFITHGHYDHIAALDLFPDAKVYAGPNEAGLIRGDRPPDGTMPKVFNALLGAEFPTHPVTELADGESVEVDGARFLAIHTPGHTRGSTVFVHDGTLFSGDTLVGHGDTVAVLPAAFASDSAQNRASISKLEPLEFERMVDGHAGLTEEARAKVEAYLKE